jgi:hypothetical protein
MNGFFRWHQSVEVDVGADVGALLLVVIDCVDFKYLQEDRKNVNKEMNKEAK